MEFYSTDYDDKINTTIANAQASHSSVCDPICEYLELETPVQDMLQSYGIKDKTLERSGKLFDIKIPQSRTTNCFTKSYGRFVEGSGSVLETSSVEVQADLQYSDEEIVKELKKRKLRYFSPREMLNLHGFPKDFVFPNEITTQQAYKLIGNSLNVKVVHELLSYQLREP